MTNGIIGFVTVKNGAVTTHRTSYLIDKLSVVSVHRPFLGPAVLAGGAFAAFGVSFADLLLPGEILTIAACIAVSLFVGIQVGQLKLLSRDLRASELSGVVWGRYAALQIKRSEIVAALHHKYGVSLKPDSGDAS